MKYLVLILLAVFIPVSTAHAIESPFTSKSAQMTNRVKLPKNPFSTKNPFSNTNQKVMQNLRRHQPQTAGEFTYNGDDSETPFAKSRERLKSSPINRSRSSDSSVFYRD